MRRAVVRVMSSSATTAAAVRKSKVYTRTGDKGTSSLFNGSRQSKTADYFSVLGDTDELNAQIGVARVYAMQAGVPDLPDRLAEVQSRLFDIGAHVATPRRSSSEEHVRRTGFDGDASVRELETWIDEMDAAVEPLTTFILPGGGLASAHLHVARAVARRAERALVPLVERGDCDATVGAFVNRLSDFLFVAARFSAMSQGEQETKWRPKKNNTAEEKKKQ